MIPKIIHLCWHWEDLPDWGRAIIEEWREKNPDCHIKEWLSLPDALPSNMRELLTMAPTYRFKSDLVRYWILHQYGGVYVDMDTRPIRPLDDFIFNRDRAFAICWGNKPSKCDNFFMGAPPESKAFRTALNRCSLPSAWADPERYFGSLNVLAGDDGFYADDIDPLPRWTVRNARLVEATELLSRPKLIVGPEYLKHYGFHGDTDFSFLDTPFMKREQRYWKRYKVKVNAQRIERAEKARAEWESKHVSQ